jgi:predicted MFS family arabinose efflux permease
LTYFYFRVFLPFALGYFLSYALRTINAVIAPQLTSDLGLTAASLGFLTAAYFLSFAFMQVPLGIWLDRYRPRRVEAMLLLVAAIGSVVFATAQSLPMLVIARVLIGIGVCCCLMASLRTFGLWLPKEKLPLMNGIQLAVGSVGAIASTAPAQALLPIFGWRGLFWVLALLLVVGAAWLWFLTPDPKQASPLPAAQNTANTAKFNVWAAPAFWTLMPFAALNSAHGMSVQALWASPWLLDVAGVPKPDLGLVLVTLSVGMLLGNLF